MRILLVIAMLLGSVQLAAKAPVHSKNSMRMGKGLVEKIQRVGTAALLGATLMIAAPQLADANGDVFEPVVAGDPAHRHGVVLLRSSNPDTGTDIAFHFALVGTTAENNPVLLGRERIFAHGLDFWGGDNEISLYGWHGLVASNLTVNVIEVFEDSTDGTFNFVALEIERLTMAQNTYPRVEVNSAFPYPSTEDLELLTYRLAYLPALSANEIVAAVHANDIARNALDEVVNPFMPRWRACESVPNPKADPADLGFTTCGNPLGHVALGSIIFHDGEFVATQSRPGGRLDMRVWVAAGVPQSAVDFVNTLNGRPASVDVAGKLTTTWGAIKSSR